MRITLAADDCLITDIPAVPPADAVLAAVLIIATGDAAAARFPVADTGAHAAAIVIAGAPLRGTLGIALTALMQTACAVRLSQVPSRTAAQGRIASERGPRDRENLAALLRPHDTEANRRVPIGWLTPAFVGRTACVFNRSRNQ